MAKLLRQNIGGVDYTMAGCALTGVCASAAADFIKAVTLSDGDTASDGMMIACTFANGNSAGTAPDTLTIYSSDQVNYYSDSELTQPFTLAPSGCYTIEYTGTGNAYTYQSYPVIVVGNISGPLCDTRGKPVGGALWDAGDIIMLLYTGGKFFALNREAASYDFTYYAASEETVFVIEVPYVNNSNTTAIGSILINARYGYKYVLDFYAFINESSMGTTAGRVGKVKMTDGAISGGNYLETTLKWDVDTTNKKIKFYLKKSAANTRLSFKLLQRYDVDFDFDVKFSTTTISAWDNAQYYNYFEYASPIDSVTKGNLQPVTSNAVYDKIKTFSTFTKYVITVPYLLLFDITSWWNATSSNPVYPIYIAGTVLLTRRAGWTCVDVVELGLQVSYYPYNVQSYADSFGSKIYCRNLAGIIKAGIVEYNNRYYFALKNVQDGVDIDFIGRMSGTPLLTEVASATEIYMTT